MEGGKDRWEKGRKRGRNGREVGEGGNKSISLINYETNVLIEISD